MPRAALRCLISVAAALATACGIAFAPGAVADPRDKVPWCTGDQTPADSNCRTAPDQGSGDAPGANPDVPLGVNPGVDPVTGAG